MQTSDIEAGQWLLLKFVGNLILSLDKSSLPAETTEKYRSEANEISRKTMAATTLDEVHVHHETYHHLISTLLAERLKHERLKRRHENTIS